MSSTQNPIFDITYYNTTSENQPCIIKSDRTVPHLDPTIDNFLSVVRFNFKNDLVPVYVPKIRTNNSILTMYQSAVPSDYTEEDVYNNVLGMNATTLFASLENEVSDIYSCGYVEWIPVNVHSQIPLQSQYENREGVLNSTYYHCYNTMHVATLVERLLNDLMASAFMASQVLLVKDSGGYSMLIQNNFGMADLQTLNFNLSQELWELFPFPCVPHDTMKGLYTIVMKNPQVVTYGGVSYYQIPTQYQSSSFLPFTKIAITSTFLPLQCQLTGNNFQDEYRDQQGSSEDKIITDYILDNVNDPDKMYDNVVFVPDVNYYRPISFLNSGKLTKFECSFMMTTPEGFSVPLYLRPNRYASVKIAIVTQ
jgi:hypothetical protein